MNTLQSRIWHVVTTPPKANLAPEKKLIDQNLIPSSYVNCVLPQGVELNEKFMSMAEELVQSTEAFEPVQIQTKPSKSTENIDEDYDSEEEQREKERARIQTDMETDVPKPEKKKGAPAWFLAGKKK